VKSDPSEVTAAVCSRPQAISTHLRLSPSLQLNILGGRLLGILKWRSMPFRAVWPLWLYPHMYIALFVGTPTMRRLQNRSSISIAVYLEVSIHKTNILIKSKLVKQLTRRCRRIYTCCCFLVHSVKMEHFSKK
jgi:hypothetical protein